MITDWSNRRVTVMGLGRFGGGVGVTRWLARQGARVLVTDQSPSDKLADSVSQIADCGAELVLGTHREQDFRDTDLVVVNPAVPPSSPFLSAASASGVPVTTEINLFVQRCRATTIGVTGSVGKSTTTAMIGHVLERTLSGRRVCVGGNLGISLLDELPRIGTEDVVVLELSSFQLERTPAIRWSPHIAVITNLAPNHLDWHGSFEAYADAKFNIAEFQSVSRDSIVIRSTLTPDYRRRFGENQRLWELHSERPGEIRVRKMPLGPGRNWLFDEARDFDLRLDGTLATPGLHNVENAAAACTVAFVMGVKVEIASEVVRTFTGLPHRLQRVAQREGVAYYNDSKSTTPEAAITAMNAIDSPLLLILGGYDKGIDLTPAIEMAASKAKFTACVGQTGTAIREKIRTYGADAEYFDQFEAAVHECRRRAVAGDVVLLSPACASWGMFTDYRERGDLFTRLVQS